MASGYFPMTRSDEHGKVFSECVEKLRKIIDWWNDSTYCLNGEDQASDQSYVDQLHSAIGSIEYCLCVDESSVDEVEAALEATVKRRGELNREIERLTAIASRLSK